jgi:hypothetical protein
LFEHSAENVKTEEYDHHAQEPTADFCQPSINFGYEYSDHNHHRFALIESLENFIHPGFNHIRLQLLHGPLEV